MKVHVYSVKDTKAKAFLQPFFSMNDDVCLRSIRHVLAQPDHVFTLNPQDYDLYQIGIFDDLTGKFDLLPAPEHMVSLDSLNAKPLTKD